MFIFNKKNSAILALLILFSFFQSPLQTTASWLEYNTITSGNGNVVSFIYTLQNFVGIGTNNPLANFDVRGAVRFGNRRGGLGQPVATEPVGLYSFAAGNFTLARGNYSVAIGDRTLASGTTSTAMGLNTIASADNSFATGNASTASGTTSTAIGQSTTASGFVATAMGTGTTASGNYSTALGQTTQATGTASTAMGQSTRATGSNSTAIGFDTTASGINSTAIGHSAIASGIDSTSIGNGTSAGGTNSIALGKYIDVRGANSVGIGLSIDALQTPLAQANTMAILGGNVGIGTVTPGEPLVVNGNVRANQFCLGASGNCVNAWPSATGGTGANLWGLNTAPGGGMYSNFERIGIGTDTPRTFLDVRGPVRFGVRPATESVGPNSLAVGNEAIAVGENSFAVGNTTAANGPNSVAAGNQSIAAGSHSVAMGYAANASGTTSISLGQATQASGNNSVAMGFTSIASQPFATAIGRIARATGDNATAIGHTVTASGISSVAIGKFAQASGFSSIALGKITVSGENSMGIGLSSGFFTLAQNNTMSIMGGNVGIGTLTPAESLQVNGNVRAAGLCLGSSPCVTTWPTGGSATTASSPWTAGANGDVYVSSGKVGVGTANPNQLLTLSRINSAYMNLKDGVRELLIGVDTNGGIISTLTNHVIRLRTGNIDRMVIANAGVGIGTTVPSEALDVSGNALVSGRVMATHFCFIGGNCVTTWSGGGGGGGSSGWQERNGNLHRAVGYVGIGSMWNNTPIAPLDVRGAVRFGSRTEREVIGDNSFAMGNQTVASGENSFAAGFSTLSSGYSSTATGTNTSASNAYATAMGFGTVASGIGSAAMGWQTSASGQMSMALGTGIAVAGPHSVGIGLSSSISAPITQANTMAIMGGRVGIGTGTPREVLEVAGNVRTTGLCLGNSPCITTWPVGEGGSGWTLNGVNVTLPSGNVGIGTGNPLSLLHLVATAQNSAQGVLKVDNNGVNTGFGAINGSGVAGTYTNSDFNLITNNSPRIIVKASGQIGIGTTSPTQLLEVNGNVKAADVIGNRLCIGSDCRSSWPTASTSASTGNGSPIFGTSVEFEAANSNTGSGTRMVRKANGICFFSRTSQSASACRITDDGTYWALMAESPGSAVNRCYARCLTWPYNYSGGTPQS